VIIKKYLLDLEEFYKFAIFARTNLIDYEHENILLALGCLFFASSVVCISE
jgi:hypothetical protein